MHPVATLPALTLWQPWASLIAVGAKRFETRAHRPPARLIGERIAVHAAQRVVGLEEMDRPVAVLIAEALNRGGQSYALLPRGAVLCTARLVAAYRCGVEAHEAPGHVHLLDRLSAPGVPLRERVPTDLFGNFGRGRWAWELADVRPLVRPHPCRGAQGYGWRCAVPHRLLHPDDQAAIPPDAGHADAAA